MTIKGKATSLDIAHLAGVSQPTVSRALRGSPMVNEETRKRIQAIAEQLNYKVDKNASNLRTQHSGTIALLFFEDPTPDDSQINPFFLSMLGSITRACALQSYDLLISFQQLSTNWQADYEDSNKADGLILLGYGDYLESQSRLERLVEQGTHFVRWGAVLPGQPGVSIEYCIAIVFGSRKSSRLRASATTIAERPSGVKYMLYGSSTGIALPGLPVSGSTGVRLPSVRPSALLVTHSVRMSCDGTMCCGPMPTLKRSTTFIAFGSTTKTSFERRLGT